MMNYRESLVRFNIFLVAMITFIIVVVNFLKNGNIHIGLIAGWSFLIFMFFSLGSDSYKNHEKTAKTKTEWKFLNYQAVYEYIDVNHPNLNYEKEDKERLAILLFFNWMITDDSNPQELVLHRKTEKQDDTKIFKTTNKKSL